MAATRIAERQELKHPSWTPPSQPPAGRIPAGKVLVVGVVCFLVWSLLEARPLLLGAEANPLGARRTAALTVLRPLARVSAFFSLDRLGRTILSAVGRHEAGVGGPTKAPPPIVLPTVAPAPLRGTGTNHHHPRGRPQRGPATTLPPLRTPTAAHPLRVLVAGDSLGQDFGYAMQRTLAKSGRFAIRIDGHTSSGLDRPDYFDWPAELQQDVQRYHPELVLIMLGANDATQGFFSHGKPVLLGTKQWADAYRERVRQFMGIALQGGRRRLVVVGMPIMANSTLSGHLRTVNAIFRSEAAHRPGALFVDSWHLFVDGHGHYAAYLRTPSGKVELVREGDGIHLTPTGSDWLAGSTMSQLRAHWGLAR